MPKSIFLISFFVHFCFLFAQSNIHYYGWGPAYAINPVDIIQTQDSGFLLSGNLDYTPNAIEAYIDRRYIVRTNSNGDTLWTSNYAHSSYGNANFIEMINGDFMTLGEKDDDGACPDWLPHSDYCTESYSATGDSLTTVATNVMCDDRAMDFVKNSFGGITALMHSKPVSGNGIYYVKELNTSGIVNTLFTTNFYSTHIEEASNGYWLANHAKLLKLSYNGDSLWTQSLITTYPVIADFCKANNDSLVFARYTNGSGHVTTVVKTDSSGVQAWSKNYTLGAVDIMQHSSGNYILIGRVGLTTNIKILVLNSNGDSLGTKSYTGMSGYKVIETKDGNLAILAYSGMSYILILDSLATIAPSATPIHAQIPSTNITLFPNPATNALHVQTNTTEPDFSIEIFNAYGNIVKKGVIYLQNTNIPIDELPNGIYYYRIIKNSKVLHTGKFIHKIE